MAGVKDFISFRVPREFRELRRQLLQEEDTENIDKDDYRGRLRIPPEERRQIRQAMKEIYATPEGKALIESVAANSPDGKIHIIQMRGITAALDGEVIGTSPMIVFGQKDKNGEWYSPETDGYHDISIQRTLYHEMYHFLQKNSGRDYSGEEGQHLKEEETIVAANYFMDKYYGEPPRSRDYDIKRFEGTETLDYNYNFAHDKIPPQDSPITIRAPHEILAALPFVASEDMPPEIVALIEAKKMIADSRNPSVIGSSGHFIERSEQAWRQANAHYNSVYNDLSEQGGLHIVETYLKTHPEATFSNVPGHSINHNGLGGGIADYGADYSGGFSGDPDMAGATGTTSDGHISGPSVSGTFGAASTGTYSGPSSTAGNFGMSNDGVDAFSGPSSEGTSGGGSEPGGFDGPGHGGGR